MNVFSEDDVRKLLSDTLENHAEVDLVVVARIFIEHKIIRKLVDELHYREEYAKLEGINKQREIEGILLSYAEELQKQGKLKLNKDKILVERTA